MNDIEMDFHDHESSFDTNLEVLDVDFGNQIDDDDDERNEEKELVFYRRLEDY